MKRALAGAASLVGLVALLPGCITATVAESIDRPATPDRVTEAMPADGLDAVTGASVAVVGTQLELVVATRRHDGGQKLWSVPLVGRDIDDFERPLLPADIAALPSSVVPVRFVPAPLGFARHDAAWWSSLRTWDSPDTSDPKRAQAVDRDALEHAAFVSIVPTRAGAWRVIAAVPDEGRRKLVASEGGVVPEIDESEDQGMLLEGPAAREVERIKGCSNVGKRVALVATLPVAFAADVALAVPFVLVVGGFLLFGGQIGC